MTSLVHTNMMINKIVYRVLKWFVKETDFEKSSYAYQSYVHTVVVQCTKALQTVSHFVVLTKLTCLSTVRIYGHAFPACPVQLKQIFDYW